MIKSMRCKIQDVHGLHNGFNLLLRPEYTAIVGPNGAGKTTLLRQLAEIGEQRGYTVFRYSDATDGRYTAVQRAVEDGKGQMFFTLVTNSEGERAALNFGQVARDIGNAVREAVAADKPLLILLDSLDSGASIDRLRELMDFFQMVEHDAGIQPGGAAHAIYIVAAVNSYELAKRMCVDPRTGQSLTFGSYEEYARFICGYFKSHQRQSK